MIFHTLEFEGDPFQQEEKSGIYNPPFNLVLDTKSKLNSFFFTLFIFLSKYLTFSR